MHKEEKYCYWQDMRIINHFFCSAHSKITVLDKKNMKKNDNHVEKLLLVNMLYFKNVLYSVQLRIYIDFEDMLSNQEAWSIRIV